MATSNTKVTNSEAASIGRTLLSIWLQIQSILNSINHILIGLIAIYFTALGRSLNFQNTAMHALLTVIGYHVLMAEALMSHYPVNFVTNRFSHRTKSKIHGILQLVGGAMALLGAFSKISQTEVHFTTWHGKIGLAANFMCFASITGGIVNYFQPKFVHKIYSPAEVKYRHNLFGMVTFTLGMLTIFLGYRTKFAYKYMDPEFIVAISLATVLVYTFTMIAPFRSFLDKRKYRRRS
ncbi:cytochrome b561 domain-containing protein 2 [Rhagoletis pomonella]|uniref:cytochrome b561 domain-containing protein 2 n=2 Tax=Rhagoletis TaxID=28609 RepID=UPI001783F3BA|nr:cytochrome b561 domain-containing protein 2 [Rhagoletis pomonella]